jgi:hypothetical protein
MTKARGAVYCSAQSKQQQRQCHNRVIPPATVCRWHGGASRRVKRAVARRTVDQQIRQLLPAHTAPVTDPLGELLTNAGHARALRDILHTKAAELETIGYSHDKAGEQMYAVYQGYTAAIRDLHVCLRDISRLDIDTRLLRLREAESDLIADVIRATLAELGVPATQHAYAVVAKHLRLAGAAASSPPPTPRALPPAG